jgi:hypothetical protein
MEGRSSKWNEQWTALEYAMLPKQKMMITESNLILKAFNAEPALHLLR